MSYREKSDLRPAVDGAPVLEANHRDNFGKAACALMVRMSEIGPCAAYLEQEENPTMPKSKQWASFIVSRIMALEENGKMQAYRDSLK
jgi:hypothetical protein